MDREFQELLKLVYFSQVQLFHYFHELFAWRKNKKMYYLISYLFIAEFCTSKVVLLWKDLVLFLDEDHNFRHIYPGQSVWKIRFSFRPKYNIVFCTKRLCILKFRVVSHFLN